MCLNMLDLRCVLLLVHCSKGGQLTGNRFSLEPGTWPDSRQRDSWWVCTCCGANGGQA